MRGRICVTGRLERRGSQAASRERRGFIIAPWSRRSKNPKISTPVHRLHQGQSRAEAAGAAVAIGMSASGVRQ
jgi:hypothetical protein